jgi:hypothetical protein
MKKVAYGEKIFKEFIGQLEPHANEETIVDGLMRIAMDTTE